MSPHSIKNISIVTPSYNMLPYLKRCHASIMDQEGIACEHIIIDGGSTDGTVEWLNNHKDICSISEKDKGMYDAINKGLLRAKGNILAYLNCDEQYLPGTLYFIKEYFEKNPQIDIVFGNLLVIRPDGTAVSYMKACQPRWFYIRCSHLYVFTCTMFLRRKIVDDGLLFNSNLRDIGDEEFVINVLRKGYQASYVNRYLAVFTLTGHNMLLGENARREKKEAWKRAPSWLKLLKFPIKILRLAEKTMSGAYFERMPIEYAIYRDGLGRRHIYQSSRASCLWPL